VEEKIGVVTDYLDRIRVAVILAHWRGSSPRRSDPDRRPDDRVDAGRGVTANRASARRADPPWQRGRDNRGSGAAPRSDIFQSAVDEETVEQRCEPLTVGSVG